MGFPVTLNTMTLPDFSACGAFPLTISMIEKLIVLEDIDPVIFYGVNNANMQLIKALYPKLRIVARGNVIKVLGDEEEMCAFEENITKLEKYCAEYNSLKEEVIIDIF